MYKDVLSKINQNQLKEVRSMLLGSMLVPDIADLFEKIDNPLDMIKVFKILPKSMGAAVFSYMSSDIQEKLILALNDKEVAYLIEKMFVDDAVDFVEEMPANVVERVLCFANKETRGVINKLLKYDDYTAGSIMTTEFISVKQTMLCATAIKEIKKVASVMETINVIYVTDNERVLTGVMSIRDLILSEDDDKIEDIMNANVVSAQTDADQEEIACIFRQYDFLALPIVDKEKRLVGIVTVDDIIEVIDAEVSEDIAKMAAITPNEKPYLKTSTWRLWLTRVPWLMLLMISATFTGLVISANEALLNSGMYGIVLTASIPMIMGTGGNAGGQASATIIRGIAVNEICFRDFFRVVWKEFVLSLVLGFSLSIVCFAKIMLLDGFVFGVDGVNVSSAFVISLAMFITIILAKIVGSSLPLLAKKCRLDPAVMASPFITTILDILSLVVYCYLALHLL